MRFVRVMGPSSHVVAVCQPAVAALAAAAVMAEAGDPALPRSMTLMAGPIDTQVNPTKVNELAKSRPIEWFERHLISSVPWRFPGAFRHVYPGFVQLSAFMSMNLDRHISAHFGQFRSLVGGDHVSAEAHRKFYDEYGAVMDLPAEFYLETVQRVFQEHDLPRGELTWHGEPVKPTAIRRMGLLTVEGERDDICAIGQTMAALDMCCAHSGQPEAEPFADRRRSLWRVQRTPLGERGLSARARDDPGDELRAPRRAQTVTTGLVDQCRTAADLEPLQQPMCHPLAKQKCQPSRSDRSGRPSNNRIEAGIRDYALALISENYADFGPTLAAEMLAQHHALMVSRETLRNWMIGSGLWLSRRQRRSFHQPRLRREAFGELIQIDGSEHRWFEDSGRCLHAPGVHR